MEIPKKLRDHFGKPRFVVSLQTESLSVAERKVLPIIVEWKKQVDIAKGLDIGSDDEVLASIALVRQDFQRQHQEGTADGVIRAVQEGVAIAEYLGEDVDCH